MKYPGRGEIWLADLNPRRGHEQAGQRPVLVISENIFNQGPAGLIIAIPLTSKARGIPSHVPIQPPEGGVRSTSYILCEAIRSISKDRLLRRWGRVSATTQASVEYRLRVIMDL